MAIRAPHYNAVAIGRHKIKFRHQMNPVFIIEENHFVFRGFDTNPVRDLILEDFCQLKGAVGLALPDFQPGADPRQREQEEHQAQGHRGLLPSS